MFVEQAIDAAPGRWYGWRSMAPHVESSDGDLARAIAAAAPGTAADAETELYRRFAPRVRLYGRRHLRDEDAAWDLAQRVLLLTIEKLRSGAVRDPDQICSFILGVSRTMAMDLRRRENRRAALSAALVTEPFAPEPAEDRTMDLERLNACLGRLAERERVIVLMTLYAERSARQVGEELSLAEGHVRVIRHRAIGKLRTCMTAAGEAR